MRQWLLLRFFHRDWVKNFLSKAGMGDGEPGESKMVSDAIKKAQEKAEDKGLSFYARTVTDFCNGYVFGWNDSFSF